MRPHLAGLSGALGGQILSALALVWLTLGVFQGVPVGAAALFFVGLSARNLFLARIRHALAQDLSTILMDHILRLNTDVLNYRMPGRLAEVLAAPDRVADALVTRLTRCWLNLLAVPVLLGGLAFVEPGGAVVLAALVCVTGLFLALAMPWQNGRMHPLCASGHDPAQSLASAIAHPRRWKFAGGDHGFVTSAMGNLAGHHLVLLYRHVSDTANAVLSGLALPVLVGGAVLWAMSQPGSANTAPMLLLSVAIALPLGGMQKVRGEWRIANRLLADVRDVLAAPVADATSPPPNPDHTETVLLAQGVTHGFSHRKPPRLHAVCVAVQPGEQLGITGPSGDGKSTLGRVFAGLITPWAGTVAYLGKPVSQGHRPAWIDKRPVFFHASLRDNLTLWDETISDADIHTALQIACIEPEVARRPEGLNTLLNPEVSSYSGGQLQRLEIARAVLRKPKAIILDEALDALNPEIETKVRQNLRQQEIALIIISHRQSTLAACDRVLTVRQGRILDRLDDPASQPCARLPMDMDMPAAAAPPAGLQYAFNDVTQQMGLNRPARGATLTQLARSANVLFRAQRFMPNHRWFEHAPTILMDDTGGATALATTQTPRPPDRREGIVLYDARDQGARSVWQMVRGGLWRARRDLGRTVLPAVGAGVGLLTLPLALTYQPHSAATAGVAFGLALIGLAITQIAARIAAVRLSMSVERHLTLQLLLRCRTMRADALERMPFPSLLNAVKALTSLAGAIRNKAPRALYAGALSGAALAFAAGAHSPAAPGLALACALAVCLPAFASLGSRRQDARCVDQEIALSRLTARMMAGLPRLQSLRADTTVANHWHRQKSARATTALTLWQRSALINALPWAIAVAGVATLEATAQPGVVLATAFALVGAASLGQMGIAMTLNSGRLTDLHHLLATPQAAQTGHVTNADDLEIDGLSHGFEGHPVLRQISARLAPGSITVVAGASGSGKSTLLDLVLGVMPPASGDIRHGHASIRDLDELERNRRIGAVLQHDHLETASTLRSQLSGTEPVDVARAWQLLEQVALADEVAAMPMGLQTIVDANTISTGQMQRLLIARQLSADPALLVLDEAMNAVPDAIEAQLIANFRKMGLTCLIVTHRESTIRLADTVIVLADGQVVHHGDPAPVLARPEFQRSLRGEHNVLLS
jgi:ABC-type bacteriocin/lantibiotic exporter with double-glycine peptidase domain